MATRPELSVIIKAYDFTLWLIQRIDKFPRSRKFTLGDHLERGALELLRLLVRAKYSRSPRGDIGEANLLLQQLRFLVRLSNDLRCLPISSYEFAAQQIDGIGVELGGWLKTSRSAEGTGSS